MGFGVVGGACVLAGDRCRRGAARLGAVGCGCVVAGGFAGGCASYSTQAHVFAHEAVRVTASGGGDRAGVGVLGEPLSASRPTLLAEAGD